VGSPTTPGVMVHHGKKKKIKKKRKPLEDGENLTGTL
jgi:hypothetical protein